LFGQFMVHVVTYFSAFLTGGALLLAGASIAWVAVGAFLAGLTALLLLGVAYRQAVLRNTIEMIEAEALFHSQRVVEALAVEAERARRAARWDKLVPKLSLALPVYVSLVSKCLQTRKVKEAAKWITQMERFAGKRSRRLADYFRMVLYSVTGDL